jgi:protease I
LAWAGQAATRAQNSSLVTPTRKQTHSITLYIATQQGTFAYDPQEHLLEEITGNDVREKLAAAAAVRNPADRAPCDIVIAGSTKNSGASQTGKSRKSILFDAGSAAQNIRLEAVSLGLASISVDNFNSRAVARAGRIPTDLEPLLILCIGYPLAEQPARTIETESPPEEGIPMDSTSAKKAVLIIASRNFRDEELFETKSELEKAGVETVVASTKTGIIRGMLGGRAEAAMLINDIVVDDYDAAIFIGGSGAREYFDNSVALDIARQAKQKDKVLGAICIAPSVLANAGVLEGVKATCFTTEKYKLKKAGAKFTGDPVERDGLIVTGSGPRAAASFGKAVADALTGG